MKETLLKTSLIHSIQSFHLHKHKVVYLELEYSDYLVAEMGLLGWDEDEDLRFHISPHTSDECSSLSPTSIIRRTEDR